LFPQDGAGASTAPDHPPEILHPRESVEPGAAADVDELNSESIVSSTAKLLRKARDSVNAVGSLRSVARILCLTLENLTVWLPSCAFNLWYLPLF